MLEDGMSKWTVVYEGFLFEGDSDGFNRVDYDRFEDAVSLYNAYRHDTYIIIKDNEYDVTLENDEWN